MRPLRDNDPPGTRVSVLDRTRGGGRRYLAVVVGCVEAGHDPGMVYLRAASGYARWLEWADDCRVLEEGDEP